MVRLQWFEVQGYKNLRGPVRLADLGRFTVLHAENNVGKSNTLEAIGLLFVVIQSIQAIQPIPNEERNDVAPGVALDGRAPRAVVHPFEVFTRQGYPPDEIFDRRDAQPIVLGAQIHIDPEKGDPPWLAEPIVARVRLELGEDDVTTRITGLVRNDGADLAAGAGSQAATDSAFTLLLNRLSSRRRGREIVPRFALIRADRTLLGADDDSPLGTREPLPRALGTMLCAAENAIGARRVRFQQFVSWLAAFRDLVEPGQWRMRSHAGSAHAELVLDTGSAILPLRLMGYGIQQIAVLLAHLAMTGEDIICIEEPEMSLHWSTQRALRGVLGRIARGSEAAAQIFIATHSSQFEEEPTFHMLTRGSDGPRASKKPAEEAVLFTHPEAEAPPTNAGAPLGYLTTEGLVQVPPPVQQDLGLAHGGSVRFVRGKDGHYRMLTNDQYADLFEEREPPQ